MGFSRYKTRDSKPARAIKLKLAPKYAENDPERYYTTSDRAGGTYVMDRETAKPVAHLDDAGEATQWITDKVSA